MYARTSVEKRLINILFNLNLLNQYVHFKTGVDHVFAT